ncbi:unnamed protein product [Caretta caretta]
MGRMIPRDQLEELDAEEEEDLAPEDYNDLTTAEAGWKIVMEHLQGSGTPRRMCSSHTIWGPLPLLALSWFLTLPVLEEELVMGANPLTCFTTQKRGQDNLELPSSKAALAERIAQTAASPGSRDGVSPPAGHQAQYVTMTMDKDPHIQALHKALAENMDIMLRSLLAASHNTE